MKDRSHSKDRGRSKDRSRRRHSGQYNIYQNGGDGDSDKASTLSYGIGPPKAHRPPGSGFGTNNNANGVRITNTKSQRMMTALNMEMRENNANNLMTHSSDDLGNGMHPYNGRMMIRPPSTAASKIVIWAPENGSRQHAIIRKTKVLHSPDTWRQIADVTELTIEDEDRNLTKVPDLQFQYLKRLNALNIRWSTFTQIPPPLVTLPVEHLRLQRNRLVSIHNLTAMHNLIELDVMCNKLEELPQDIYKLKHLRILNVNGNKISEVPNGIGSLMELEELHIASNLLKDLPDSICNLKQLKLLDISFNLVNVLPEEMGGLEGLIELRASANRLYELPDTLHHCQQLQYIHMRNNQFSTIPPVLKDMQNLELVNFRHNIIKSMEYPLSSVKVLLLDINRLVKVPNAVIESSNLEVLSLEDNQLKDLPKNIHNLHRLRSLNVNSNHIRCLPDELCEMQDLRHLSLKSTRVKSLPANVRELRLTVLDITDTEVQRDAASQYAMDMPNVTMGHAAEVATSKGGRKSVDFD